MPSRREFIAQATAASSVQFFGLAHGQPSSRLSVDSRTAARIKGLRRREETLLRYPGNGDNFHMSWADDDRQYASLCDGSGFSDRFEAFYNSRLFAIEGGGSSARFTSVPNYPMPGYPPRRMTEARYYNFGTLALDGCIYQFLSTFNQEWKSLEETKVVAGNGDSEPMRFVGAKLIYSKNNGLTWYNQDGSSPVVWEPWEHRSRDTMVFWEEDQDAFSILSVLQMGKNYEHNRDGYLYVYAPNGNTDGTMNELVMFRVKRSQLLRRGEYEFFAGLSTSGKARWTKAVEERRPVHTFPRGWVNKLWHPYAWVPSVTYYAPLGLYMMANWGTGVGSDTNTITGATREEVWFAKPSYLGFWVAPNPWGPWAQIHEEMAWMPGGDASSRAYQPQIAPKWIAEDGKSFWLVWTDFQIKGEKAEYQRASEPYRAKGYDSLSRDEWAALDRIDRKYRPYYSFNVQRVDLSIA